MPLTRCRAVGTPGATIPGNTLTSNRGCSGVPNLALKISMQCGPHRGVAAPAGGVPTVQRPPAMVTIAAAGSPLLFLEMNRFFFGLQLAAGGPGYSRFRTRRRRSARYQLLAHQAGGRA